MNPFLAFWLTFFWKCNHSCQCGMSLFSLFFLFLNFWISILLQHFGSVSVSGFKIGDPILKSVKRFSCNWVFIFFMKRLLYFCTNQTILKHQFYSATFTLKISITPNGLGKLFWQKWHQFLLTFQNNSVPDDLTRLIMKV